jgi:hypothetical protein
VAQITFTQGGGVGFLLTRGGGARGHRQRAMVQLGAQVLILEFCYGVSGISEKYLEVIILVSDQH